MSNPALWDTEKVKAWVKGLGLKHDMEQKVFQAIDDNEINGAVLKEITTKDELKDMGLESAIHRSKVFKEIKKLDFGATTNSPDNFDDLMEQNAQNQTSDVGKFKIDIIIGSNKAKTSEDWFYPNSTIRQVRTYIVDKENGGELGHCIIMFNTKSYDEKADNKLLKDIGVHALNNIICVRFRSKGGATLADDEKKENQGDPLKRQRYPHFKKNDKIKPTLEPDCIMGYDERKLRVKMPCGHVFAPVTIYQIANRAIEVLSKNDVRCPMLKCNQKNIWDIDLLIAAADLNRDERVKFSKILNNRKAKETGEVRECPYCHVLTERPKDLTMQRVRCTSKSCSAKPDYCWICGQQWKGGGFRCCGNDNCVTAEVNREIQTCGTTRAISGRSDVACFIYRACPRCLALVEYDYACKHMKCWGCHKKFCFICLALQNSDETWPCGGTCPRAPRQTLK